MTRFDDAWREALGIAGQVTEEGFDVVVIRDLLGRVSLLLLHSGDRIHPTTDRARIAELLQQNAFPSCRPGHCSARQTSSSRRR